MMPYEDTLSANLSVSMFSETELAGFEKQV